MGFIHKGASTYLKGVAIIAVATAHYVQYFVLDYYRPVYVAIAQGFLSFFFLTSGFGIYLSLEKRFKGGGSLGRLLARFYFDRALRIYPLYWLALLLTPYFITGYYDELHQLSTSTIAAYLLVPFIRAPNIFWFMTLIVQCYLLAPFLYLLIKKMGIKVFILMNILMTSILFVVSYLLADSQALRVFTYKGFMFGHLLIFSFGMVMPIILRENTVMFVNRFATLASGAFFVLLLWLTSDFESVYEVTRVIYAPLFFASVFVFCLYLFGTKPYLPFSRIIQFPGRYSYSIYLFHLTYFGFLAFAGLTTISIFLNVLIVIAFLPIFLLACALLETGSSRLTSKIFSGAA